MMKKNEILKLPLNLQLPACLTFSMRDISKDYFSRGSLLTKLGFCSHLPLWKNGPDIFGMSSVEIIEEKSNMLELSRKNILKGHFKVPNRKELEEQLQLIQSTGKSWANLTGFNRRLVKMRTTHPATYVKRRQELEKIILEKRADEISKFSKITVDNELKDNPLNRKNTYSEVMKSLFQPLGFNVEIINKELIIKKNIIDDWFIIIQADYKKLAYQKSAIYKATGVKIMGFIGLSFQISRSHGLNSYESIVTHYPEAFFPISTGFYPDVFDTFHSFKSLETQLIAYSHMYKNIQKEYETSVLSGIKLAKELKLT